MKKNTYYTLLFALLALLASSCTEERMLGGSDEGGDAVLHFRVSTPAGGGETRAATRNGSAGYENPITGVMAIVFDNQGKVLYTRPGLELNSTPATGLTKFRIDARASASPVTLWLVANVSFGTGTGEVPLPLPGQSMSEVRAAVNTVVAVSTDYGIAQGFPYWGEKALANIPADSPTSPPVEVTGIKMLRAVAKATIAKTVDDATLKITSLRIYRMNNRLAAIPAAVNAQNAVTAPTLPAGTAAMTSPIGSLNVSGFPTQPLVCYLSEGAPAANEEAAVNAITCLVIGGQFGGSGTETFYRADFPKGNHTHPGEILRNHHYEFSIQGVSGPGLPTPDDAANAVAVELKVSVKDWVNTSESLQTGQYEFSIGARDIPLAGGKDSENYTTLFTNIPGFYLMFAGGAATTQATGTIENENFRLKLTTGGSGSYRVTATALKDNTSATPRVQTVQVSAGKLSFALTLTQAPVSELKPATTFLWVASDGEAHKQTIAVTSSHPWHVDAAQTAAWIKHSATSTELTVWGEPNHDTANESRTGTLHLVNDLNQQVFITVKQTRWVEWAKAFLKGGNHYQGDADTGDPDKPRKFYTNDSRWGYLCTPLGTPYTLAAAAGDVHRIVPWEVGQAEPANYNMYADYYYYADASAGCAALNTGDNKKWKLPSHEESVDFLLRKGKTANGTLFFNNPDGSVCYMPYFQPMNAAFSETEVLLLFAERTSDLLPGMTHMFTPNDTPIFYQSTWLPVRCVRDYRP